MGNTIFIKGRKVCVKLLRSRLESIQKLKPPTTVIGGRSFTGMVNFLSFLCPELQKLLKSIYDLTRKGRQFIWGEEQQRAFDKVKGRLVKLPVLHVPENKARFHSSSDTSKFVKGRALYQI